MPPVWSCDILANTSVTSSGPAISAVQSEIPSASAAAWVGLYRALLDWFCPIDEKRATRDRFGTAPFQWRKTLSAHERKSGRIAARVSQAFNESGADWIRCDDKYDRNGVGEFLKLDRPECAYRDNGVDFGFDKFSRQGPEPLRIFTRARVSVLLSMQRGLQKTLRLVTGALPPGSHDPFLAQHGLHVRTARRRGAPFLYR